ncbi:hypothetical protein CDV31_012111 [Fusarium ambrosium]|uniref:Uncharacterized protein n=1 Tax=Fusarium ambrosium TaxID=131363 RepID=A0A428TC47_9HYPO|nr:hypothetical protein CDV31_012111 [Fusarium ambrosium]
MARHVKLHALHTPSGRRLGVYTPPGASTEPPSALHCFCSRIQIFALLPLPTHPVVVDLWSSSIQLQPLHSFLYINHCTSGNASSLIKNPAEQFYRGPKTRRKTEQEGRQDKS